MQFKNLWEAVATQTRVDNNTLRIPDPTGQGLEIVAQIELLPGQMGTGSYLPVLAIKPRKSVNAATFHGQEQHSLDAAQAELVQLMRDPRILRRFNITGLPTVMVSRLKPKIAYNDEWNATKLQQMPGYNSGEHELHKTLFSRLIGDLDQAHAKVQDQLRKVPRFGDSKPQFGQYITISDIEMLPDLVESFGDFWIVLRWANRNRQVIKASDLAKHYKRIVANAEVKSSDFIQEMFVRKKPFEGI